MESSLNRYVYRFVALLLVVAALNLKARAQEPNPQSTEKLDRVELRQGITSSTKVSLWQTLQVMTLEGQIRSFDAKSLVLTVQSPDGSTDVKNVSSDQVQYVAPVWRGVGTEAAVKLFDQHKYADFSEALTKLEIDKIPAWQQVLLTSMVIQVREAHNQIGAAGDSFIELAKFPIPELVYGDMPLCWTVSSVDVTDRAQKWIDQDSEAAKLLGASWLLLGPESQKAKQVLLDLQKSNNSPIAQLAKAQAWRLVPAPNSLEQLSSWNSERDRMLRPLALGPTEFISDRLMRIGQHDLAIGYAMQIATLYPNRFPRARRALVVAADVLKKHDRKADAEKVSAWISQLDGAN